jgi:hypothetical protein
MVFAKSALAAEASVFRQIFVWNIIYCAQIRQNLNSMNYGAIVLQFSLE